MTGRGRPYIGRTIEVRLPDGVRTEMEARAKRAGVPLANLCRRVLTEWADGPDWTLTDWVIIDVKTGEMIAHDPEPFTVRVLDD